MNRPMTEENTVKKLSDKQLEELRKPFPAEAISQHPTKTFLSTIKAIYVTERLNNIFGIGGWDLQYSIIEDTTDYVTVQGRIVIPEYSIQTPMQFGGHTKIGKNTEPADGYKSAMTDCQSKCASYLEIGIDVFKGKVKGGSTNRPKTPAGSPQEQAGGNADTKKQCPYCKEWHTGLYPKCMKCWKIEKDGGELKKTKTVVNENEPPFEGDEFASK